MVVVPILPVLFGTDAGVLVDLHQDLCATNAAVSVRRVWELDRRIGSFFALVEVPSQRLERILLAHQFTVGFNSPMKFWS